MKLVDWEVLLDTGGYSSLAPFAAVRRDIERGIKATDWPDGTGKFTIYPESGKKTGQGNGVKPIKLGFMKSLTEAGWTEEFGRKRGDAKGTYPGAFDAHFDFKRTDLRPFVVEWETGNVSSTHRAVNRIALGILEARISGGVVVLPSAALAPFLTDRIGNFPEMKPYLPLWRKWETLATPSYLALVVVEHDETSFDVPRIPKGTDGRAKG